MIWRRGAAFTAIEPIQESDGMGLLADLMSWSMLCFGLGLVILVLLRRSHRYYRRLPRDDAAIVRVPPRVEGVPAHDGIAVDSGREEVRLHDTVREMSAQLDNKIRVLEYLTGTAQQRIDQLETLLERSEAILPRSADGSPPAPVPDSPQGTENRPAAEPYGPHQAEVPRHTEIYFLADQGFSAPTIAHRTGVSLTEVETVLRQRQAT